MGAFGFVTKFVYAKMVAFAKKTMWKIFNNSQNCPLLTSQIHKAWWIMGSKIVFSHNFLLIVSFLSLLWKIIQSWQCKNLLM